VDYLDDVITTVSERVATQIAPFARGPHPARHHSWVNQRTAEVLIAELGVDMRVFPSERHLASWVALCPGQNESAGKQHSGKTRHGNRWLRAALTEAALSASRSPKTAFATRYHRLKRHRGHKKAVIAVAHHLAVTVYHLLSRQSTYREIGAQSSDQRHATQVTRLAVHALERQGYASPSNLPHDRSLFSEQSRLSVASASRMTRDIERGKRRLLWSEPHDSSS
jgi:hypothetical protein